MQHAYVTSGEGQLDLKEGKSYQEKEPGSYQRFLHKGANVLNGALALFLYICARLTV